MRRKVNEKFAKFITMSAMIATLCATGFCTVYAEDESTGIEQELYEDLDVYSVNAYAKMVR